MEVVLYLSTLPFFHDTKMRLTSFTMENKLEKNIHLCFNIHFPLEGKLPPLTITMHVCVCVYKYKTNKTVIERFKS